MNNPKKIIPRSGEERRKIPDRRRGFDRRDETIKVSKKKDVLFNTKEACKYLTISRPTYLKYIAAGTINARKIGRGWKVLKSDLDIFLRGVE